MELLESKEEEERLLKKTKQIKVVCIQTALISNSFDHDIQGKQHLFLLYTYSFGAHRVL